MCVYINPLWVIWTQVCFGYVEASVLYCLVDLLWFWALIHLLIFLFKYVLWGLLHFLSFVVKIQTFLFYTFVLLPFFAWHLVTTFLSQCYHRRAGLGMVMSLDPPIWSRLKYQILDCLPWNMVQIFTVTRGWIIMNLVISKITFHLAPPAVHLFLYFCEMCHRLFDGLPWNVVQTFLFLTGWME